MYYINGKCSEFLNQSIHFTLVMGEGEVSHFSEGLYRRDLGQFGILSGNWHFR